jgi:phage repressor protein C with HTH and peptisase S24 domain
MAKKPSSSARKILQRIDRRIEALKVANPKVRISDRSVSIQATGSPDTLRSIRRQVADGSQRGVSTETIEKLAPALETTAEWLLHETGPESPDSAGSAFSESQADYNQQPTVRVVGYVGAGATAHFYAVAQGDLDEVPAPANASESTVAVEIRGESLGPLFDKWIVFYDQVRSPVTPDLIGRLCVVGLADDRVLVKKIRRARNGHYDLVSNTDEDTMLGVEIQWAARVKNMVPR